MTDQTADGAAVTRNPRTLAEAEALVRHVVSLFMPWDVDGLVDGFTPDCVVRFGALDEFRGHDRLRAFFETRRRQQPDYVLQKQVRALMNDTITNQWQGTWRDGNTGKARNVIGFETWQMRDGRIAVWEAAFNFVADDGTGDVTQLLTGA